MFTSGYSNSLLAIPHFDLLRHSSARFGGEQCIGQQIIGFIDTRWHWCQPINIRGIIWTTKSLILNYGKKYLCVNRKNIVRYTYIYIRATQLRRYNGMMTLLDEKKVHPLSSGSSSLFVFQYIVRQLIGVRAYGVIIAVHCVFLVIAKEAVRAPRTIYPYTVHLCFSNAWQSPDTRPTVICNFVTLRRKLETSRCNKYNVLA
jgi:hypothetical protein